MKYHSNSPEAMMINQLNQAHYIKRVESEMAAYRPACLSRQTYFVELWDDDDWQAIDQTDDVASATETFENAIALMGLGPLRLVSDDGQTLATSGY